MEALSRRATNPQNPEALRLSLCGYSYEIPSVGVQACSVRSFLVVSKPRNSHVPGDYCSVQLSRLSGMRCRFLLTALSFVTPWDGIRAGLCGFGRNAAHCVLMTEIRTELRAPGIPIFAGFRKCRGIPKLMMC